MAQLMSIKKNVDVQPGAGVPAIFHCSQGDKGTRIILGLLNNNDSYTIPEGTTAIIRGSRADGTLFTEITADIDTTTEIKFNLTEDMTSVAGPVECEAVMSSGTANVIGTANFIVNVEKSPASVGSVFPGTDAAETWLVNELTNLDISDLDDESVVDAINSKLGGTFETTDAGKVLMVNNDGTVSPEDVDLSGKANESTIAPEFDSSASYTAGQYVYKNGVLYRFTSDHAAGAWTGTDAEVVTVVGEVEKVNAELNSLNNEMQMVFPQHYTLSEPLAYYPAALQNGDVLHIEAVSGAKWTVNWGILLYNANMEQLTALHIAGNNTSYEVTVNVSGTAYMRPNYAMPFAMVVTIKDTTGVTLESKVKSNTESILINTAKTTANTEKINSLKSAAYVVRNVIHTKDINVIDFIQGIYTNTGAINTSVANYFHSPLFEVNEGFVISYTNLRTFGGWCLIACFDAFQNFDANKSVISEDSSFKSGSFTVPAGVGFISIMAFKPNTATVDAYEATIPEMFPVSEIIDEVSGAWNGKTAVIIGDSITDGLYTPTGGSEPDTRANPIYWQTAGAIIGVSAFGGYGISGTSISRTSSTLPSYAMSIRYTEMINGADLIIVAGGTNDYGTNVVLGTIADQTDISFYGALNVLCDGLQTKYPGKRIVFITPIHRANEEVNQAGATLEQYRQAIYDVARDVYGFAVIDGKTMGISCKNTSFKNVYIYDGLHPTQEGHDLYGLCLGHALNGI